MLGHSTDTVQCRYLQYTDTPDTLNTLPAHSYSGSNPANRSLAMEQNSLKLQTQVLPCLWVKLAQFMSNPNTS